MSHDRRSGLEQPLLGTASGAAAVAAAAEQKSTDAVGGAKNISFIGGVALIFNNITGPGLITIPLLFQQSGWFTPSLCMLGCFLLSALSSQMMCQTMSRVPGNDQFQSRIEFTTLSKQFFPRWGFVLTILLMTLSLLAQVVSAIVISAQTMDLALVAMFKKTYAIEFYPEPGFASADASAVENGYLTPFGSAYVLTAGYGVVLAVTLPLGIVDLSDNIIVQKGAVTAMLLIIVEWFVAFFVQGLQTSRVPFYVAGGQSSVLGTILFNYAYVITIPSWLNEKQPGVSINKTLFCASGLATLLYLSIGLLGGLAFDFPSANSDLLDAIDASTSGFLHIVSHIAVFLFPAVALLSSIPVFCIIIRYNLVENRICRKVFATFWGVVFPWILSIVFYAGSGLLFLINWASLLVNGFVNFVIPMLLFAIATYRDKEADSAPRAQSPSIQGEAQQQHSGQLDGQLSTYTVFPRAWPRRALLAVSAVLISVVCAAVVLVIIFNFLSP